MLKLDPADWSVEILQSFIDQIWARCGVKFTMDQILHPDFPVHCPHFNEITNMAMTIGIRRMTGVDTFSAVNSQKVYGDPTEAAGVNLYRLVPLDSLISVLQRAE